MAERTATEPTAPGEVRVRRALISVSDKGGIVDFARGLAELGVELVSTGGTARALEEGGLEVRTISESHDFPEIMDGRVKTLHPKLYASLLARRDDASHLQAADEQEVEWVDLVAVNLYPFEQTVARLDVPEAEVIENIDIGGPTMIRAAAKNFAFSAVVVDPATYDDVLAELRDSGGRLSLSTREGLAARAFAYTARYDTAIARWFGEREERFPPLLVRAYEKVTDLRYGENPHQRAAYYSEAGTRMHLLSRVQQHGGKELSFNNLLDLDAARRLVDEFTLPACAIVKHNNPCGCALGEDVVTAYRRAFAADPMSAFGGIIAVNRPVDRALAEAITEQFAEVVFAPGYSAEALEVLGAKQNLRVLEDTERRHPALEHAGAQAGARRGARTGPRHRARAVGGHAGRDQARAHRRRARGAALCMAGVHARPLQRDRAGSGPGHRRHRRGPDEPRRLGAPGRREEHGRLAGRRRARVGRVLPVRGWPRAGDRGRDHGDHPARRVGARRAM